MSILDRLCSNYDSGAATVSDGENDEDPSHGPWASWQSVYKTMTTLEIRFMKCVFRHSDARLDFVCRLFCFELEFSVQSLGMIGLRH